MELELVCISDTRGKPPRIIMTGNILLHSGSCTATGKYSELREFIEWMDRQPHERKFIVPGDNEIGLFSKNSPMRPVVLGLLQSRPEMFFLIDDSIVVLGGITFRGP